MPQRPRYATLLALSSIAGLILSCWFLFRAGCAGNSQSGDPGVPVRSMELERFAVPFLFLSVAAGLAFIASLKYLPVGKRILWGARLVLFGLPIAWVLGVQFELLALRICA